MISTREEELAWLGEVYWGHWGPVEIVFQRLERRKSTQILTLHPFPVVWIQRNRERDPEVHHGGTDISSRLICFSRNLAKDEGYLSRMENCTSIRGNSEENRMQAEYEVATS